MVWFTRLHHKFYAASNHGLFQLGLVKRRLMDMLFTLPDGRKSPSRHEAHPPGSGVVCARHEGHLTCVIACFGSKLDTQVCTIPCVKSDGCILAYGSSRILRFYFGSSEVAHEVKLVWVTHLSFCFLTSGPSSNRSRLKLDGWGRVCACACARGLVRGCVGVCVWVCGCVRLRLCCSTWTGGFIYALRFPVASHPSTQMYPFRHTHTHARRHAQTHADTQMYKCRHTYTHTRRDTHTHTHT